MFVGVISFSAHHWLVLLLRKIISELLCSECLPYLSSLLEWSITCINLLTFLLLSITWYWRQHHNSRSLPALFYVVLFLFLLKLSTFTIYSRLLTPRGKLIWIIEFTFPSCFSSRPTGSKNFRLTSIGHTCKKNKNSIKTIITKKNNRPGAQITDKYKVKTWYIINLLHMHNKQIEEPNRNCETDNSSTGTVLLQVDTLPQNMPPEKQN